MYVNIRKTEDVWKRLGYKQPDFSHIVTPTLYLTIIYKVFSHTVPYSPVPGVNKVARGIGKDRSGHGSGLSYRTYIAYIRHGITR